MTAPHNRLVSRVERRIREAYCNAPSRTRKHKAWHMAAEAAVAECHAEEAIQVVRKLMAKYDFNDILPDDHPVVAGRALLAKLDGRS